jgi:hypothetical protein
MQHRRIFRPLTQDEYKISDCDIKDKPWCTTGLKLNSKNLKLKRKSV